MHEIFGQKAIRRLASGAEKLQCDVRASLSAQVADGQHATWAKTRWTALSFGKAVHRVLPHRGRGARSGGREIGRERPKSSNG